MDHTVKLWKFERGVSITEPIKTLTNATNPLTIVLYDDKSEYIFAAGGFEMKEKSDNKIYAWKLKGDIDNIKESNIECQFLV